ncbi:MAG: DUF3568 family protein [Nitrospinae bacterium]|nr:DUF3568 family protein [Nitrospinota bacterium]
MRVLFLLLLFSALSSCAILTIAAPILVSGVGAGASYSLLNIAHKTITYDRNNTYKATIIALERIGCKVGKIIDDEHVRVVKATTDERNITIELEIVTKNATKLTVDVVRATVIKDKATAEEIIRQVVELLDHKTWKESEEKAALTIMTEPENAKIRILNIKEPFRQGILLQPDSYHIEVSSPEYKTKDFWIELKKSEDKFLEVKLKEEAGFLF